MATVHGVQTSGWHLQVSLLAAGPTVWSCQDLSQLLWQHYWMWLRRHVQLGLLQAVWHLATEQPASASQAKAQHHAD